MSDGEDRYLLFLVLRSSAVDGVTQEPVRSALSVGSEAPSPTGHAIPVPWSGQYPRGFLARYCWW